MPVASKSLQHVIIGVSAACVLALISPVSNAVASSPAQSMGPATAEVTGGEGPLVTPEEVAAQVAEVPVEMRSAIERDLGITGEEYVQRALVASSVVDTVAELEAAGVTTLGSELVDDAVTIFVADGDAAAAVEAAGFDAVVGSPSTFDTSNLVLEAMADVRGGSAYTYPDGSVTRRCSVGIAGFAVASGAQQALTAGHCLGDETAARRTLTASGPSAFTGTNGDLGRPVAGSYRFGDGYDHGLIAANADQNLLPELLTWGGGSGAPMATTPLTVRDATRAVVGAPICRTGSTTGWRCGEVLAVDAQVSVSGQSVNGIVASVCSRGGDSGGAAVSGTTAVGVTSGGTGSGECSTDDITIFAPLYSAGSQSAEGLYRSGWEPRVAVDQPTVSIRPGFDVIEGTVPHGTARHRVVVVIDGSITRTATLTSSGSWQIDISDLGDGAHTYVAQAWWGTHSKSATVTGDWESVAASRLSGASRYDTAVEISKEAFSNGARIAFVASGENYPDALSAGPVAAKMGGPLLLSPRDSLPGGVLTELHRLDVDRIIVVGGPGTISPDVMATLSGIAATTRVAGVDRYETSRKIAEFGFTAADRAFIATGRDFPDALSASAAAASLGVPVLLVDGKSSSLDTTTAGLLEDLNVNEILVAGGSGTVSSAIESDLGQVATTHRLAGASRYETSVAINQYAHTAAPEAFIALGTNFPDGLSGSVLAGVRHAPMYIAPTPCVPPAAVTHMRELGVTHVTLFGSQASLADPVASLTRC